MDLKLAILTLAAHLQADPAELESYAHEADALGIGGYHNSKGNVPGNLAPDGKAWQSGSVWAVEGAMLYMLARLTKAHTAAEIGGFWGCSASWLAAALKANGGGTVYSVDSGILNAEHGSRIPADLRAYVTLVNEEGAHWLDQSKLKFDLIFSDASHDTETTASIAKVGWMRLAAGGVWVEHDAMHDKYKDGVDNWYTDMNYTGAKVRAGLDAAALPYRNYLVEPSDCGLAIARKPVAKVDASPVNVIDSFELNEISPTPNGLELSVTIPLVKFDVPNQDNVIFAKTAFKDVVELPPAFKKPAAKRTPRKAKAK